MIVESKLYDSFFVLLLWLSHMTKCSSPKGDKSAKRQHKNATKMFDFIAIANQRGTVSWSIGIRPTCVMKRFYEMSTFLLLKVYQKDKH